MNAACRVRIAAGVCFALLCRLALADGIGLERRIWAHPELSALRLRVTPLPGGGLSVEALAGTRDLAEKARAFLARESEAERFQVDFDPGILRAGRALAPGPALERAALALRRDAGTRPHAGLLDTAQLGDDGVLSLPSLGQLDAATERRFARLLLAQPGIAALRFVPPGPTVAALSEEQRALRRTRLELDPLQPEAAAIASADAVPRTRLHVDLPEPQVDAPAAGTGLQPPVRAPGQAVPSEAALGQAAPGQPALGEEAPIENALSAAAPLGLQPAQGLSPPESSTASIDQAIEELLVQAMRLRGAPATLEAHVRTGVVLFAGEVESLALALELREYARKFDGVRRVTGDLLIAETGERLPMDAIPD